MARERKRETASTQTRAEKRAARQQRKQDRNIRTPGFKGPGDIIQTAQESAVNTAQQTRDLNLLNEVNPYGSTQYRKSDDGSLYRETTLSQPQQEIQRSLEGQESQTANLVKDSYQRFQDVASRGMDLSSLPQAAPRYIPQQDDAARRRYEQAYFDRGKQLLDKSFTQQADEVTADLRNRGYQFGSDPYQKLYDRQVTDPRRQAEESLASQAILAGGQEQANQFNMNLQGNAQNYAQDVDARTRALNESLLPRNLAQGDAVTFAGLQRGVTNPTFAAYQPTQINPVDVAGLGLGFADMANAQLMQKRDQNFQKSLPRGGGGSTAMGFNDWLQRQQVAHDMNLDTLAFQSQLSQQNQPKKPSVWEQAVPIAGNILGGLASNLF